MIWSSDAAGALTYMGPEWHGLTGLPTNVLFEGGWRSAAHGDDRLEVDVFFAEALSRESGFCITFRLRSAEGSYVWVKAGAMPSVSVADREFIGFLGTITEWDDRNIVPDAVFAEFGSCGAPPCEMEMAAHSVMELIADHVLLSHSLAVRVGDQPVREALEVSLVAVGRALAQAAVTAA